MAQSTLSPIDVVITWVDGNSREHRLKRHKYADPSGATAFEDVGGEERYSNSGEIKIAVASVLRFAPFVRTIFIVTDQQNPQLDNFVAEHFPHTATKIQIVDHTEIYGQHSDLLPVFNSLSIETMIHRIPGLSDRFVYFNDDMMLLAPITENDWFDGNSPVCYSEPFSSMAARTLRTLKNLGRSHKKFGYKDAMLNAADLLRATTFPYFPHGPLPQRRDLLAKYFSSHPEELTRNAAPRFRDRSQFNPQTLCCLLARQSGEFVQRDYKSRVLFLKPRADKPDYMRSRLEKADANRNLMFGCCNSLSEADPADRRCFIDWIERRLNVKL